LPKLRVDLAHLVGLIKRRVYNEKHTFHKKMVLFDPIGAESDNPNIKFDGGE